MKSEPKPLSFYPWVPYAMMALGVVRAAWAAFVYPPGEALDSAMFFRVGIGLFYFFSGLLLYLFKPPTVWGGAILFAAFFLEMNQIGFY